jgi:thymidylate kinase
MSIVIVEGPDGSGKTTLIRRLREGSQRYFVTVSFSGPPKRVWQIQSVLHWIEQSIYLDVPIICDRFPLISESIYGPILRGKNLLDETEDSNLRAATEIIRRVTKIIYCRPPIPIIRENVVHSTIPHLLGVLENLNKIVEQYDELMDLLRDETTIETYDFTDERVIKPVEELFFQ